LSIKANKKGKENGRPETGDGRGKREAGRWKVKGER
jgi:hypothetical protein